MTGAPDHGQHGQPGHQPRHGIGDEQVAAAFAEAFGWPSEQEARTMPTDPLREAFVSSATRALEPDAGATHTDAVGRNGGGPPPAPAAPAPDEAPSPAAPPADAGGPEAGRHRRASMDAAVELCAAAPGYVAAAVVLLPAGTPIAHDARFPALDGDRLGRMVVHWVEGLATALGAVGGQDLFGLVDTGMITTEAATVHLGLVDDRHAVVLVTDVASDEETLVAARQALVECAVAVDNLLG